MYTTLTTDELCAFVAAQLNALLPDARSHDCRRAVELALERTEHCFSRVALTGYMKNERAYFNHLHGDQSAVFLYFAANSAWKDLENEELATRLFLLNKMRNGFVCMYDTALPNIFIVPHTVGIVLGKATYGDYFVACPNVVVAGDQGQYPVFGERVVLFVGATVLGACRIGSGVAIGANSFVGNADVPADSLVTGQSPQLSIRPRRRDFLSFYFRT